MRLREFCLEKGPSGYRILVMIGDPQRAFFALLGYEAVDILPDHKDVVRVRINLAARKPNLDRIKFVDARLQPFDDGFCRLVDGPDSPWKTDDRGQSLVTRSR